MTDAAREAEGLREKGELLRARMHGLAFLIAKWPGHRSDPPPYEAYTEALARLVQEERASARREALNEAIVLVVSLRVLALGQDDLITADALKIIDERIRALASPGEEKT